jgi:hypothetical protein
MMYQSSKYPLGCLVSRNLTLFSQMAHTTASVAGCARAYGAWPRSLLLALVVLLCSLAGTGADTTTLTWNHWG